jgi:hypothetical protein
VHRAASAHNARSSLAANHRARPRPACAIDLDTLTYRVVYPGIMAVTSCTRQKLTAKTVDCGKKWGMAYIGDHRTETTVLIAVSDTTDAILV